MKIKTLIINKILDKVIITPRGKFKVYKVEWVKAGAYKIYCIDGQTDLLTEKDAFTIEKEN
jgi:hypothetical protein